MRKEEVGRIILTRPAVEAGEALGFLPGDLQEKIFPYLRPLYDALHHLLEAEELQRYMDKRMVEIAPLAYMRGRTLDGAFIVLDEAQNTTTEQMFMFLTRMGQGSKCVVTGDRTQIDLPSNKRSGLVEAIQALKDVPGIGFSYFEETDVVRHELVQKIIRAYRNHRYGDAAPTSTAMSADGEKTLVRTSFLRHLCRFVSFMVDPLGVLASLKKNQLVKKGYACGKTRRRPNQSHFLRSLESSDQVKTIIFLSFLVGLAALIFYGNGHGPHDSSSQQAEQFLFALLVFFTALTQLWINHPQTFAKNSRVLLMFGTVLTHLLVMKTLLVLMAGGAIPERFGKFPVPVRVLHR